MKIISIIKDGKRVDMTMEKFQKMLEETKQNLEKKEVQTTDEG